MKGKIRHKLRELEQAYNINVLLACESGSRAWGFPSPDSDFDIRIIYKHDLDWYLSLNKKKDTIEMIADHDMDISGWDIGKTLHAVHKSNASPLEWIQSDMIYQSEGNFIEQFGHIAEQYFSPMVLMHHYHSMSKRYFGELKGQEYPKLKSCFYAIRTTLAGAWIREKQTVPPLHIGGLLDLLEPTLKNFICELVKLKAGQNENYCHKIDAEFNQFLAETIASNEAAAKSLPVVSKDFEPLNHFFRTIVK